MKYINRCAPAPHARMAVGTRPRSAVDRRGARLAHAAARAPRSQGGSIQWPPAPPARRAGPSTPTRMLRSEGPAAAPHRAPRARAKPLRAPRPRPQLPPLPCTRTPPLHHAPRAGRSKSRRSWTTSTVAARAGRPSSRSCASSCSSCAPSGTTSWCARARAHGAGGGLAGAPGVAETARAHALGQKGVWRVPWRLRLMHAVRRKASAAAPPRALVTTAPHTAPHAAPHTAPHAPPPHRPRPSPTSRTQQRGKQRLQAEDGDKKTEREKLLSELRTIRDASRGPMNLEALDAKVAE